MANALASTTDESFSRQTLAGRYELLALLGSGGMGAVYLARDLELGEPVAVKMIHPEMARDDVALSHFRNEVRLARRVTHVNVARTFDIGEHGGARFLTMQYIDGEALSTLLARDAPLSPARLFALADDICAGLAAAHEAGVIHRDLKPQNVLVARENGRAVITDFGIALSASEVNQAVGDIVGTPMYMAPEQLRGEAVGARADVFAFGAILFLMATGRRPFAPKTERTADTIASDPRWLVPTLPTELGELIVRCMANDPSARFADASDLRRALGHANRSVSRQASSSDAVRERRLVRAVREERLRSVALEKVQTRGLDESYGEGIRGALLARLAERRELHAVLAESTPSPPESVLRTSVELLEDRLVLDVVLESRDGYQVLAERLEGAPNELLVLTDRAAESVARALATPGRHVPSSASFRTREAMDFFFRARAEYRGYWVGAVARSIELFEQADTLSPDHPLVLSALAIARARNCWFVGSGLDAARAVAERAARVAADRPEGYLGLASVAMQSNRPVEGASALARAISLGPGFVDAQIMLARLFGEVGAPMDAITLARNALTRAPDAYEAWPELMRTQALLGDLPAVDAVYRSFPFGSPGWLPVAAGRSRIGNWYRDDALFREIVPQMRKVVGDGPMIRVLECMIEVGSGRRAPFAIDGYDFLLPANPTPRRRSFHFQHIAEAHVAIGDHAGAVEAIERSVSLGLCDAMWITRCPMLDVLRGNRRFEALSDEVRARGMAALAAFDDFEADEGRRETAAPTETEPTGLAVEKTAIQTRR